MKYLFLFLIVFLLSSCSNLGTRIPETRQGEMTTVEMLNTVAGDSSCYKVYEKDDITYILKDGFVISKHVDRSGTTVTLLLTTFISIAGCCFFLTMWIKNV